MRNRGELFNRLESEIDQEIKNYKDSLSSIYLKLNALKEDIDSARKESLKNDSSMVSNLKDIETKFLLVKDTRDESISKMNRSITMLDQKYESMKASVDVSLSKAIESAHSAEYYGNAISLLTERLVALEDKVLGQSGQMGQQFESMAFQLKKELARVKDEILSRPSEALEVKKELEDKMNSNAVDSAGLLKEIRMTNKAVTVLEKMVENLYTLVARLQESQT